MGRVERIRQIAEAYGGLRAEHPELEGARLQISQPAPIDMCLFVEAGGLAVSSGMPRRRLLPHPVVVAGARRHLPVYTNAVINEIKELTTEYADLLSWQIESPLATLMMVRLDGTGGSGVGAPLLA